MTFEVLIEFFKIHGKILVGEVVYWRIVAVVCRLSRVPLKIDRCIRIEMLRRNTVKCRRRVWDGRIHATIRIVSCSRCVVAGIVKRILQGGVDGVVQVLHSAQVCLAGMGVQVIWKSGCSREIRHGHGCRLIAEAVGVDDLTVSVVADTKAEVDCTRRTTSVTSAGAASFVSSISRFYRHGFDYGVMAVVTEVLLNSFRV